MRRLIIISAVAAVALGTVGIETADMLVHEILSRKLRDRRAVARYAGLTGAPDESGSKRVLANRFPQIVQKTGLHATHRTISFAVSLSFSSWRIVSRGARCRASSRLKPTANNTPASAAATTAETR